MWCTGMVLAAVSPEFGVLWLNLTMTAAVPALCFNMPHHVSRIFLCPQ